MSRGGSRSTPRMTVAAGVTRDALDTSGSSMPVVVSRMTEILEAPM
jgi:hypothetical protein